MSRYAEVYQSWQRDPDGFWAEAARDISWYKTWDKPFDASAAPWPVVPRAESTPPTTVSTGTSRGAW
jgi:hypothetical protein